MRYSIKKIGDSWYVNSGKTYFPDTKSTSKTEAIKLAAIESGRWHQEQMDKCKIEWEKAKKKLGEDVNYHTDNDWCDHMA